MHITKPILLLSVLSLLNCQTPKSAVKTNGEPQKNTAATPNSEMIYLNEGENRFFKEYEMNMTFKGISEDSRCPEGVNCVWAGVAVAQLELMGVATRPFMVSLATMNMPAKNYSKSAVFNGYRIDLKQVLPARTQNGTGKTYRIGFTVTKLAENQTDDPGLKEIKPTS